VLGQCPLTDMGQRRLLGDELVDRRTSKRQLSISAT
jgi:hypothetical protein